MQEIHYVLQLRFDCLNDICKYELNECWLLFFLPVCNCCVLIFMHQMSNIMQIDNESLNGSAPSVATTVRAVRIQVLREKAKWFN